MAAIKKDISALFNYPHDLAQGCDVVNKGTEAMLFRKDLSRSCHPMRVRGCYRRVFDEEEGWLCDR